MTAVVRPRRQSLCVRVCVCVVLTSADSLVSQTISASICESIIAPLRPDHLPRASPRARTFALPLDICPRKSLSRSSARWLGFRFIVLGLSLLRLGLGVGVCVSNGVRVRLLKDRVSVMVSICRVRFL